MTVPLEDRVLQALEDACNAMSHKSYVPPAPSNRRSYGCEVEGCRNIGYAKGMCNAHYKRKSQGRRLSSPLRNRGRSSVYCSCGQPTGSKGSWGMCKGCAGKVRWKLIKLTLVKMFGSVCDRCKVTYPDCVFDFHHVNNDKERGISYLIGAGSLQQIAQEAAKCILLCSNCHRTITHGIV